VNEQYEGQQYVGIDLHRRRSVMVRMTAAGERLETLHLDNDLLELGLALRRAGEDPQVVLEATYGWYWAADVLAEAGAQVHLAHPLGIKGFAYRRVKNDERDAADLADLLRMNRLPESWIAPRETRQLRELVRHRAKLVALRTGLKCEVHAVLAKQGVAVPMSDLFGYRGQTMLEALCLDDGFAQRMDSARQLICVFDNHVDRFERLIKARLKNHGGYQAIQVVPGVGPLLGAVFIAEIGDVTRFPSPAHLASWAGLTPRHRESDTKIHRGHITKQGSKLVRWAAIEAVQRLQHNDLLPSCAASKAASRNAAAATSARSPPPASSSVSSTTACATARSAA